MLITISYLVRIVIVTVFVVSTAENGNFGIALGQGSNSILPPSSSSSSSLSLTPQQKAAMCNPNNPKLNFVNSTESEICGIPTTSPKNATTTTSSSSTANNTTKTTQTGTGIPSSSLGTSIVPPNIPTIGKQTRLYYQGYAKGVADAKLVQPTSPPTGTMMRTDDVDCDSDINPQTSNPDYCSGYQHGFADTYNRELVGK